MKRKDPEEARLLRELLETAVALDSHGLMSKPSMSRIKALCEPPPAYSADQVVALRTTIARMSQSVFATLLNVSLSTVQKWESPAANKPPNGAALRLLQILERHGVEALLV